jgi:ribosomal protein L32
MNYTHYDLGGLAKGKTVEVTLQGHAANVYLMDHENMAKYIKAKPFEALGGLMTFSPIRLQTVHAARWHIVIDLPKGHGTVKTGYRMLTNQAPNISTRLAIFKPTEEQKRAVAAPQETSTLGAKAKEKPKEEKPAAPKKPEQVTCPKCGILTLPGKFCADCGAPMEQSCPDCSVVNPLSSRFCYECGNKL